MPRVMQVLLNIVLGQQAWTAARFGGSCYHTQRHRRYVHSSQHDGLGAGGVSAASMLVSATSSNAILGGQQLAQAADVGALSSQHICFWGLH